MKEFNITCWISQMNFWSTCFESGPKVRIWTIWKWTKTLISNAIDYSFPEFMMLDRCFGPLSNCPNAYFWSRFKVRLWTKRKFAMQILHVILLEILKFQYWIRWNTFLDRELDPFVSRDLVHSLLRAYQCISDYFWRFQKWEIRVIKVLTLF